MPYQDWIYIPRMTQAAILYEVEQVVNEKNRQIKDQERKYESRMLENQGKLNFLQSNVIDRYMR